MVYTYDDYLGSVKELPIEECQRLHNEMAEEILGDPDAEELYNEVIEAAADYSSIRALWTIRSFEWRADHDDTRTMYHDAVIMSFNVLARYLRQQGKAAAWRDCLGYDEKGDDRKRIGDFACFLVFIHGINGR